MLPIKLKIEAFSSYLHPTTINFEDINERGLYLISGDTGSGKTTIFDAICFALYGEASGSERPAYSFRSDLASYMQPTQVELTFLLHQKYYTVSRVYSYTKTNNQRPPVITLTYDDQIIEGLTPVNQKIKEILGVDVNQFKQIVMIAQGEFTRLIYASSKDREEIFRNIFHTHNIVDFEEKLKDKTRLLASLYESSQKKLDSYLAVLGYEDQVFHISMLEDLEKALKDEQLHIHQEQKHFNNVDLKYQKIHEEYLKAEHEQQLLKEYQTILHTYNELIKDKEFFHKLHSDINSMKEAQKLLPQDQLYQQLLMKKTQFLQTTEELERTKIQLNEQTKEDQKNKEMIPVLEKKAESLKTQYDQSLTLVQRKKEYQEHKKSFDMDKKDYQVSYNAYQEKNKHYQDFLTRLQRDQKHVETLPSLSLTLEDMDQKMKAINERRIVLHELSDHYDTLKIEEDHHFELSQHYQDNLSKYRILETKFQQADDLYKAKMAGIMAQQLQVGKPCPVCGSLDHPSPAKLHAEVLSSSELEKQKEELVKMKEELDELYHDVILQNEKKAQRLTQIQVIKKQLHIEEDLSKEVFIHLLSEIKNEREDQQKRYLKIQEEVIYLKRLQSSINKDESTKKQYEESLMQLKAQYEQSQQNMLKHQGSLESLTKQYPDLQAFNESVVEDLHKHYTDCITTINQMKQTSLDLKEKVTVVQTQIKHHALQVKELELQIKEVYTSLQKALLESFKNEESYQHYVEILDHLEEKEKSYQDYLIQLTTTKERLKDYQEKTKDLKEKSIEELKQQKEDLFLIRKEKEEIYNQLKYSYDQHLDVFNLMKKECQSNAKVMKDYTLYSHLNDLTSGKNIDKISFERYVLATYFEHILDYANSEFKRLTGGRYKFLRRVTTRGNAKQGLDLDVLDYETGISRDVKTLSGGESFKAALALALGLSAMIQNYAGGIELNTLFIDEGFGSLDAESLDQAIHVLIDLKNDHKTIGIISHVEELKQRIDTQIVVSRKKEGSSLDIVYS